jgi:hypothetical protein
VENEKRAVEQYAERIVEKLSSEAVFNEYVPLTEVIAGKRRPPIEEQIYSWLEFDSGNLMALLGDCGAGKTILSKKICFDLCNQLIKGLDKHVPILLDAEDALAEIVALNPLGVPKIFDAIFPDFSHNSEHHHFLIILDGLDVLSKFDIQSKSAFLSGLIATNHKILITSRSNLFESEKTWVDVLSGSVNSALGFGDVEVAKQKLQIIHLPHFRQWDISDFLRKKFLEDERKLSWKLMVISGLEDVCGIPLLLDFISEVLSAANEKSLSAEESLYSFLVKSWFERETRRGADKTLVTDFMTTLALEMFLQNLENISNDELNIRIKRFFNEKNPQIEFLPFNSMVRLSGFLSCNLDKYSFNFTSIQNYLVIQTLKEKIDRKEIDLIEDFENIVFPDHGDFGSAKMNEEETALVKINKKYKSSYSKIFELNDGFTRMLGSTLLNRKVEGNISDVIFNCFVEKQNRDEDFSSLLSAAQKIRGKTETKVDEKRVKHAFQNVHMIGGEGRIYYHFNIYNFALLIDEQNPNAKWALTVSKSKSWIHT